MDTVDLVGSQQAWILEMQLLYSLKISDISEMKQILLTNMKQLQLYSIKMQQVLI